MSFSMLVEKPIKSLYLRENLVLSQEKSSTVSGNISLTVGFFATRKSAKNVRSARHRCDDFQFAVKKVRPKFWQKSITLIVQNYKE